MVKHKQRVVIIGGNFAGISALKEFNLDCEPEFDVTVIDPQSHFTWTPNIHEILSGVKHTGSVEITREQLVVSLGAHFIKSSVTKLDSATKSLLLSNGDHIHYDACVLCCGNEAFKPDDAEGYTFKNASDVTHIKQALDERIKTSGQAIVTVIGGGFSGVEALGELLRHYKHEQNVTVRLIDGGSWLLKDQTDVVASDIVKLCDKYNVEFIFEQRVQNSLHNILTLKDGTQLESDVTIWTTGSTLPDFLVPKNALPAQEHLSIRETLQLKSASEIFTAGDVAPFLWKNHLLPKQSYYAQDMGQLAARNVKNFLLNKELAPFEPVAKPVLIAFGDLNTYMVSGSLVLASPSLAATKEALYQLGMYKIMASFPLHIKKKAVISRLLHSTKTLLIPQLNLSLPSKLLLRTRVLQRGKLEDLHALVRSAYASLLS